jgi:hypothetical protein
MAGHWATQAVRVVPVFGERGAWLDHAVFDAFYNFPLSLGVRIRQRDALAAAKRPRWWAVPAAGLAGAALTALADFLFVRAAGRVPSLNDLWWAVFLAPFAAGFLASSWSRRRTMGKRIIAGIVAGGLVGAAYGLVNVFLSPHFTGFVPAAAQAFNGYGAALGTLWKTFVFALLAIPGAFIAETRPPGG